MTKDNKDNKKVEQEDVDDLEVDRDNVDNVCVPEKGRDQDAPYTPNVVKRDGSYNAYRDPKRADTATDIYYKTECKLSDSKVAIPTEDSVEEAKEWVDDANKM